MWRYYFICPTGSTSLKEWTLFSQFTSGLRAESTKKQEFRTIPTSWNLNWMRVSHESSSQHQTLRIEKTENWLISLSSRLNCAAQDVKSATIISWHLVFFPGDPFVFFPPEHLAAGIVYRFFIDRLDHFFF